MKKSLLTVGATSIAIAMFATGCVSQDDPAFAQQAIDFIEGSKKWERIELTENPIVDPLIGTSTVIYVGIGGEIRETVETNFGEVYVRQAYKAMSDAAYSTKWEATREGDKKAQKELFEIFEKEVYPKLDGLKKELTPQIVFDEMCDQDALERRREYLKAEDKSRFAAEKAWLERGAKVAKNKVSKIDWARKDARMKKLQEDLAKLQASLPVSVQKMQTKITELGNEIAKLAQNPAMQNFVKETVPLTTKKMFASAEECKAIDAQIDTIAAKEEYKGVMATKAKLEAELTKAKDDLLVLTDKVGGQVAYTAKAIPWVIESNSMLKEAAGK